VYTSWGALYTALSLTPGAKTIVIDDTIVSPAVIPAGTWNLDQCIIQGEPNNVTPSGGAAVSFADGAAITSPTSIYFQSLTITKSGAAPVISATAGQEVNLFFSNDVSLIITAGGPFAQSAGGYVYWNACTSSFGDGVHAVAHDDGSGGTTYIFALIATYIDANAVTGGAGCTIANDGSSEVLAQPAGTVFYLQDYAGRVEYVPTTPGNWNPALPATATVNEALDQLAADVATPTPWQLSICDAVTGWNAFQNAGVFAQSNNVAASTVGTTFSITRVERKINGIRFYWKSPGASCTIRPKLWQLSGGGVLLATAPDVVCAADGFYESDFASPIAIPANKLGLPLAVTIFNTSSNHNTVCTSLPATMIGNAPIPQAMTPLADGALFFYQGSGDVRQPYSCYATGDALPSGSAPNIEIYPVGAVFA
jgi:hypothetical protein